VLAEEDDDESKSESRLLSSPSSNQLDLWDKPSYLSDLEVALERTLPAEVTSLRLNLEYRPHQLVRPSPAITGTERPTPRCSRGWAPCSSA
jgi:hypothetical protein